MENFKLKLAGITVGVSCLFSYTESFCKGYITDGEPDIYVETNIEDCRFEQSISPEEMSEEQVEQHAVYRKIAEQLPRFSASVFHGAAITYKDKAYIFTAPSGTGKTTHIKLWREHLGKCVDIINGDKPVLKAEEDKITVFGTPWCGKEKWQKNRSAPLAAICVIKRGSENSIRTLSSAEAIRLLMKQLYLPKNAEGLNLTLELLDKILKKIPIYELTCDISKQAVKTSFEKMTGEIMEE